MQNSKTIAILLTATMLTACTEPNGAPGRGVENGGALSKTDVGVAIGAVAGGIGGAFIGAGWGQAAAVVGGALIGGTLGGIIGNSLDNADRAAYDRASQNAMETGQPQSWENPETGHYGTVHPHHHYKKDGKYCREYTQTITVDGKTHEGHGTACRQKDGTWKIVE